MTGKIKGQHMGRSNGNRGHVRWHTSTDTQLTPETPYLKINAPHDFIHTIAFHSTLHQGQHKDRSNESCGLMHWHTYKINVTPNRDSNAFPILNVRALLNNGSNRKHAHVAIIPTRCGTLTRFSNDV